MRKISTLLLGCFFLSFGFATWSVAADKKTPEGKVRVVIIDGQNNHAWRATTPHMKAVLEKSGFYVDVSSNLREGDKPGNVANTVPFPHQLANYDVLTAHTPSLARYIRQTSTLPCIIAWA